MLNADDSTSPLAAGHRESEHALREADVPFTLLRNGYYTEVYADLVGQYLQAGEIVGAAGHDKISAASRQDYAAAAATALLHDAGGNRAYELGGPAHHLLVRRPVKPDSKGVRVLASFTCHSPAGPGLYWSAPGGPEVLQEHRHSGGSYIAACRSALFDYNSGHDADNSSGGRQGPAVRGT
jgi:hypothetical protein